jgi:hypothetical protein
MKKRNVYLLLTENLKLIIKRPEKIIIPIPIYVKKAILLKCFTLIFLLISFSPSIRSKGEFIGSCTNFSSIVYSPIVSDNGILFIFKFCKGLNAINVKKIKYVVNKKSNI